MLTPVKIFHLNLRLQAKADFEQAQVIHFHSIKADDLD
jgi:hypothetical protein